MLNLLIPNGAAEAATAKAFVLKLKLKFLQVINHLFAGFFYVVAASLLFQSFNESEKALNAVKTNFCLPVWRNISQLTQQATKQQQRS